MTLLDRFRTSPRHKHPDPSVRLAFVAEIPVDDRETIAQIAREDEDARVRRAAVAKLMDVPALGRIAQHDADESVRTQAITMLRDIALEAFEGLGETEAGEAADAITDPKVLTQVARNAAREGIAVRALSRVTDAHLLGSLARHAATEATRRGALRTISERGDSAEVLAVAMNSEFKDTAVAAVELLADRAALEQIAVHSKNKNAAKRARTAMRDLDAASSAAPSETTPPSDEEVGRAREETVDRQEEAREQEAAQAVEHQQAQAKAAEEARAAAQLAKDAKDEDEALRKQETQRRHSRLAELVEEVAAAAGDADLASAKRRVALARSEWRTLTAGIDLDSSLATRFADAETLLTSRETELRDIDARSRREALVRLQHLLSRVEPLATKPDVTLKAAERAARDLRTALTDVPPLPTKQDFEDVTHRLKAAQAALTPKLQELRDADDWQRWANAGVQEQLCAKMEALQALEDPAAIAHEVHALQVQWRAAADVPRARADALWRRFKAAHDVVWPRCEAHFTAQAQERSENLAKKTTLCEKAESLADSTNWIQTAEAIKALQAEWKTIGAIPRGREKAIWERFRSACDKFFTRRHDDLAQRKTLWADNLTKKIALCEKAEAVAQSSEWEQTAAEIRRLQAEWKTIGPVKKTRSEAIWQRFRAACDVFFARYAQRHEVARAERVAAREAICEELAAFASANTEEAAFASPNHDEASASQGHVTVNPEATSSSQEPSPDLLAKVRALQTRWQQELAARGVDPDRARALDERYAAALADVIARWPAAFAGTDLDPHANRTRMEDLVRRMEDLARSIMGPGPAENIAELSPTVRLAAMLKEALAANTIGGKSSDDGRWRAAAEEVRQAQASWSRIGHVAEDIKRALGSRFQRACRTITEAVAKSGVSVAPAAMKSGGGGRAGNSRR